MTVSEIAYPSAVDHDAIWVVHLPDPAPTPSPRWSRVVALGVACGLLVALLAAFAALDERSTAGSTTSAAPVVLADVGAVDVGPAEERPSSTVGIEPSTPPALADDVVPVAEFVSPEQVAASQTGEVPALEEAFGGGWVAELGEVPYGAGMPGLEATWRRLGAGDAGVVVTSGETWSTLTPGRWYLLVAGSFPTSAAADAFCASLDTVEGCRARRLG